MITGNTEDLEFGIFNGSTWETKPATSACDNDAYSNASVAWENSTGKAFFVFVLGASDRQLSYRTWDSTGGFSSITTLSGQTDSEQYIRHIIMQSSTDINAIIVLFNDSYDYLYYRYWDGSMWSSFTDYFVRIEENNSEISFSFVW